MTNKIAFSVPEALVFSLFAILRGFFFSLFFFFKSFSPTVVVFFIYLFIFIATIMLPYLHDLNYLH